MSQFSIDAFRANLINGLARNNLFLVQGNFPGSNTSSIQGAAAIAGSLFGGAVSGAINSVAAAVGGGGNPSSQVSFLCKASKIPSSTININQAFYMGRPYKYPGDKTFADWSVTCDNDGGYGLRKAFEAWMNLINSNRTNVGPNTMNQFMTDWTVSPLTREGSPIVSYKLVGCWPSTMTEVALDMGAQTEPSTFDVTIAYQYFEINGVTT
jgi:hypothetical protein